MIFIKNHSLIYELELREKYLPQYIAYSDCLIVINLYKVAA